MSKLTSKKCTCSSKSGWAWFRCPQRYLQCISFLARCQRNAQSRAFADVNFFFWKRVLTFHLKHSVPKKDEYCRPVTRPTACRSGWAVVDLENNRKRKFQERHLAFDVPLVGRRNVSKDDFPGSSLSSPIDGAVGLSVEKQEFDANWWWITQCKLERN